jgi:hypothetical protein
MVTACSARRWNKRPLAFERAAVEAEGELIEVVVQMLALDAALMRAEQPALERPCQPYYRPEAMLVSSP